jgi:CRP/FNR family transcriptional regulator, cyclic AMP receptor protein
MLGAPREESSVSDRQQALLLELDSDLGQLLDPERFASAREELRVPLVALQPGPWEVDRLAGASPDHIGLLVVEGIIAREVLVWDTISTELLGPGDVIRPWRLDSASSLLDHMVRWSVLTHARVALLDRRMGTRLGRYPEVNVALIDRVVERALRLSLTQAISQINRVDRRLLALFWHLAERWGRMTSEGVAIPMTLSHRLLGQLVGARRPTISAAVSQLTRNGELVRRDDGTWLLRGTPAGVPAPEVGRVIPMKRRLVPEPPSAPAAQQERVELYTVLHGLRERTAAQIEAMRETYVTTTRLVRQTADLRRRYLADRNGR